MSEQQPEIDAIFMSAIEIESPPERAAYLDRACGNDAALRQRIEKLIAAHFKAGQFLQSPAPGMPAEIADEMIAGSTVGPYTLLEQIGEGGMGVVFRARQSHPVQREVALKVIKLGMDTHQVIERFGAERQALAILDHPNIAKVFDAGATMTGRPYFVMERVAGDPVTDFCDRRSLSIGDRLDLFVQICRAVQHAHQKGLIHRDIKPSNVLVSMQDDKPFAKVIDFGIAKATDAQQTHKTLFTEEKQLIGTPQYMSPEQAEGSADIDTRTDIYSLGVLLYELLTGATPFDARQLRSAAYGELQRIIREVEPPRPSTRLSQNSDTLASIAAMRRSEPRKLTQSVHGELDWIAMKALEKDRARRYESAAAFADDILHHLADEAVSAGPPSQVYRLRKFVRRHRAAVVSAAIIGLLLVGGIAGTTLGLLEARRQRDEAQRQQKQAEEHYAQAMAVSRFQADMLASADPSKLLGDKVTVLQAVTAAVKELDAGKLNDQPLVEANVRTAIGNTLSALGRFDLAGPNFQRALEVRRDALAPNNPLIAPTLRNLALNLQNQGRLNEAEPIFRESLEIYRKAGPAQETSTPNAVAHVAEVLKLQGRLAEAEALAREALDLQRKLHPVPDATTDGMLTNLGLVLRAQQKLDEAEPLLREALLMRRNRLPADHPDLARGIGNLAGVITDQKKFEEAEALFREVLQIQTKSLPANHPDLARTHFNLGWVLMDQDKPAEAEALFREATPSFEQALGKSHWMTANSHRSLGVVLTALNRYGEAEVEILQAERVLSSTGDVHIDRYARCLKALVALYTAWDKSEPGKGYDIKARQWQEKLPLPATTQSTNR